MTKSWDVKRILELSAVAVLVIFASATAFIWFPVAAAAAGVAGLGVGIGWAGREVWSWYYDSHSSIKVHPLAKMKRERPILPAA